MLLQTELTGLSSDLEHSPGCIRGQNKSSCNQSNSA
uniref:Uncharacterized protein n=1 Tax=Anguilla anguilla TaxID=7936 RepID=A0A0E9SXL7_ANGAN